ncbi:MAG: pimeloyl-ACP methyl ester esterase BioH [Rhodanobacteraceae bacterium]
MSDLHIETHGHGDRHLVLLHGWAMHGGIFAPLIEALADRCTMHVVDLPGHGHSRDSSLPLEANACASAIAAATPPALWLGWSMGGLVALAAAQARPDHVRGLAMLCSSPCLVRKPGWNRAVSAEIFDQFGADLDQDFQVTLDRFLALEAQGSDHAMQETRKLRAQLFSHGKPDARMLKQGLELLKNTDHRAGLATLELPSVWLAGARDRIVPWRAMQWAAEACGGQCVRVGHAAHAPFIGHVDEVVTGLQSVLEMVDA